MPLIFTYCAFIFAVHKLAHMIQRKNPLITMNKEGYALHESQTLETNADGFMMAFGLRSFEEAKILAEMRFVKWVGWLWTMDEQVH